MEARQASASILSLNILVDTLQVLLQISGWPTSRLLSMAYCANSTVPTSQNCLITNDRA